MSSSIEIEDFVGTLTRLGVMVVKERLKFNSNNDIKEFMILENLTIGRKSICLFISLYSLSTT